MTNRIPPLFSSPLLTLVLVLMPSIPVAARCARSKTAGYFAPSRWATGTWHRREHGRLGGLSPTAPPEVGGEPVWVLEWQPVARQLDNNLKCVYLSDLAGDLPLDVVRSTEICGGPNRGKSTPWAIPPWSATTAGRIRTDGTTCTTPTMTWSPASVARSRSPSRDLT